jgi:hypothetical protein
MIIKSIRLQKAKGLRVARLKHNKIVTYSKL